MRSKSVDASFRESSSGGVLRPQSISRNSTIAARASARFVERGVFGGVFVLDHPRALGLVPKTADRVRRSVLSWLGDVRYVCGGVSGTFKRRALEVGIRISGVLLPRSVLVGIA